MEITQVPATGPPIGGPRSLPSTKQTPNTHARRRPQPQLQSPAAPQLAARPRRVPVRSQAVAHEPALAIHSAFSPTYDQPAQVDLHGGINGQHQPGPAEHKSQQPTRHDTVPRPARSLRYAR